MKIFENRKIDCKRTVRICGLPVYFVEKSSNTKHQEFLGGVFNAYKKFEGDSVSKEIRFFNLILKKFIQNGNIKQHIFMGIKYREDNLAKKFVKKHKKLLSKYDSIYVLHANIGESVVFLKFAKSLFEKNGAKNPIIIGTQRYHRELVNMFLPNIDVEILRKIRLSMYVDKTEYADKKIYLIFPKPHYDKVEDSLRDKNADTKYFVDHILNFLGLRNEDFSDGGVTLSEDIKESMLDKVREIGLNLDNFVIFSPEANTCEEVDIKFWQELKSKYENLGIDVFCNLKTMDKRFEGFKTCDLSLGEIFALSEYSQKIIGLRSGLLDLLAEANKPMEVLYTKARDRDSFNPLTSDEMLAGFEFKKENIREFNADKMSVDELLR